MGGGVAGVPTGRLIRGGGRFEAPAVALGVELDCPRRARVVVVVDENCVMVRTQALDLIRGYGVTAAPIGLGDPERVQLAACAQRGYEPRQHRAGGTRDLGAADGVKRLERVAVCDRARQQLVVRNREPGNRRSTEPE